MPRNSSTKPIDGSSESVGCAIMPRMNRRQFGQTLAGAALSAYGCSRATAQQQKMIPEQEPFELNEATVSTLQAGMQSGKHTARSITELYLRRIEALDKQGPSLH